MTSLRADALLKIRSGDVVYALADDGSPKILLVCQTTEATIFTRLVTSGTWITFDREGRSSTSEGGYTCTIVSVEPLPKGQHDIVLGLERKMRTAKGPPASRLTKAETELLLTVDEFYLAHPLSRA